MDLLEALKIQETRVLKKPQFRRAVYDMKKVFTHTQLKSAMNE
jgi:hypothetical protein